MLFDSLGHGLYLSFLKNYLLSRNIIIFLKTSKFVHSRVFLIQALRRRRHCHLEIDSMFSLSYFSSQACITNRVDH